MVNHLEVVHECISTCRGQISLKSILCDISDGLISFLMIVFGPPRMLLKKETETARHMLQSCIKNPFSVFIDRFIFPRYAGVQL